jgi:hypothetical protein
VEDRYKRELIQSCHRASFSGDAVVSLLNTQVKQQGAWSVSGWVTATRYSVYKQAN